MLILNRKEGERIRLSVGGKFIWITLVEVNNYKARSRLGILADPEVEIMREELLPHSEQFKQGEDHAKSSQRTSDSREDRGSPTGS